MGTQETAPEVASRTKREPTIFISHKHVDRNIADAVREFVRQTSRNEVAVYQSSSGVSEGPELGRPLTEQLKDALWKAGIVILIYTSEDQDWQWCMWECGVALNPHTPDTRVIVFQCAPHPPRVFQDQVRVDARNKEDLLKFVRTFLTDPSFFPGFGRALAPKLSPHDDEVRDAADELHKTMASVLPRAEVAEWPVQPLMRLQLPLEISDKLAAESALASGPSIEIADVITVTSLQQKAKQIFGIAELSPATTLSGLAMRWAASMPGESLDWVTDIESQIRRASQGEIPTIRWGYMREIGGSGRYAPLLTCVRRIPGLRSLQFDVNLLPYNDLAAIRVTARMISISEIACHHIDKMPLSSTKVRDLALRFKHQKRTRMPFIDNLHRVQMIVHRSMIDGYLASKVTDPDPEIDIADITMADMLEKEPELKSLFETSLGFVGKEERLIEVKTIMGANPNIQDVFVTETGKQDEPVLGWITNAMMAQHTA
jgi:TIR domain